jgi:hypothetical protein
VACDLDDVTTIEGNVNFVRMIVSLCRITSERSEIMFPPTDVSISIDGGSVPLARCRRSRDKERVSQREEYFKALDYGILESVYFIEKTRPIKS